MNINVKKIKFMVIVRIGERLRYNLQNEKIERVESFRHLVREDKVCTQTEDSNGLRGIQEK